MDQVLPRVEKLSGINTYNEKALHLDLKQWYAQAGDVLEAPLAGYFIDIVRGDLLIEIQTGNFTAIRNKLEQLAQTHSVRLVYPIAQEKWIVKLDAQGERLSRRKSPARRSLTYVFAELVRLPTFLCSGNTSLDIVLIQEEETRVQNGQRAWRRRGWVTQERRLLRVVESRLWQTPADCLTLLPATLPTPFTTANLATALDEPRWLAQKMVYCLRAMKLIVATGKQGNAILYTCAAC